MPKSLARIGEIECYCCLKVAPLKAQGNGLAIFKCDWCGFCGQAHDKEADSKMRADAADLAAAHAPALAVPPIVPLLKAVAATNDTEKRDTPPQPTTAELARAAHDKDQARYPLHMRRPL